MGVIGGIYPHTCNRRPRDRSTWTRWMVCRSCLPDFQPVCEMCHERSPKAHDEEGFSAFYWGPLCFACVRSVESGGEWKARRARASAARAAALCLRFPALAASLRARTTHVEGAVEGRQVHVRLRVAAREGETERYVFSVACAAAARAVAAEELGLDGRFVAALAPVSAKIIGNPPGWLRVSFAHLGKLDTVLALEQLLAAGARFER